ncbi:MAG: biotin--[acetyl-CoA-carboxylase] ligase [Candidatus Marinimicrobia bacterium]|nr:biotin--[acetyl-CoA-carboxylase] ligase [Candidatus Neomarinimicrobiota bacterium]
MTYHRQTIGTNLYVVNEIDSTNKELLENAAHYEHGAVFCSRKQTAGRGRQKREWHSQNGGLYFSVLLKDQKNISKIYPFVLLSALAVVRCIHSCATHGIAIKWPNDIYINHRKVCGILTESSTRGNTTDIVIGIGINVNNNVSHIKNLRNPAVSLKECREEKIDLLNFLDRIINEIDLLYFDYCENKFHLYLPELNRLLYAKGQIIEIKSTGNTRLVTPLSFTEDAKLLCLENGKEVEISIGEI